LFTVINNDELYGWLAKVMCCLCGSADKRRHKRRKNNFVGREMHVVVSELHGSLALELTDDHQPDREDERLRVEANGGFVENQGGVPRVNGQLAVSRSIGDVALKK
jgi:hypothetical protein